MTNGRRTSSVSAAERPDVVAFQELNGYAEEKLLTDAEHWGHGHAVMLKTSGYPTAVTSNQPIEMVERELEGMDPGWVWWVSGSVPHPRCEGSLLPASRGRR